MQYNETGIKNKTKFTVKQVNKERNIQWRRRKETKKYTVIQTNKQRNKQW